MCDFHADENGVNVTTADGFIDQSPAIGPVKCGLSFTRFQWLKWPKKQGIVADTTGDHYATFRIPQILRDCRRFVEIRQGTLVFFRIDEGKSHFLFRTD